jgi:hypothetical protein
MGGNCHRRGSDNGQRSHSSGTLQVLAQAANWDLQLVLAEAGNCWQQQGYGSGGAPASPGSCRSRLSFDALHCFTHASPGPAWPCWIGSFFLVTLLFVRNKMHGVQCNYRQARRQRIRKQGRKARIRVRRKRCEGLWDSPLASSARTSWRRTSWRQVHWASSNSSQTQVQRFRLHRWRDGGHPGRCSAAPRAQVIFSRGAWWSISTERGQSPG